MQLRETRRRVRRRLSAFVAFLAVQAAIVGAVVELYPALIYPPFARVKGETGLIDVLQPEIVVSFADGSFAAATLEQAFAGIPLNLATTVAKETLLAQDDRQSAILNQMRSGSQRALVRWRASLRRHRPYVELENADPQLRGWLRDNLARHLGRTPVGMSMRWWNVMYADAATPVEIRRTLLGSQSCRF
jgi:hypothetical protein